MAASRWNMRQNSFPQSFQDILHSPFASSSVTKCVFMNDIFGDLLDICVLVYEDDILIYSDDPDLHRDHVREVLRRLRKHHLYARTDKCFFHKQTVEYLRYILSPTGLTMDTKKIDVIQDWPEPQKVKDMQSFLGFANFY